jgi:leucyl aminopeptidase (aminopeptidase T)
MDPLISRAAGHAADIVHTAIGHEDSRRALVVFDSRSPLSRLVTEAYRVVGEGQRGKRAEGQREGWEFLDFDSSTPEEIAGKIRGLQAKDLAVMIQSTAFQLAEFRFRIELFQREIAVIEHVHLERATDHGQIEAYVDSLAYDPSYYRPLGRRLKERLDAAQAVRAHCAGTTMTYGAMEPAKLNVGDYAGMKNVGGTFPIGEVFTEPKDLMAVNGEAMIFAFAGIDHLVQIHEPFKIRVQDGVLVSHEGPAAFQEIIDQIGTEEAVMLREFGIGLNPAFGKHRVVKDITAFERQRGLHFSLGEKHTVYKKPGINAKKTHFHIDIFVDVERIDVDGEELGF